MGVRTDDSKHWSRELWAVNLDCPVDAQVGIELKCIVLTEMRNYCCDKRIQAAGMLHVPGFMAARCILNGWSVVCAHDLQVAPKFPVMLGM